MYSPATGKTRLLPIKTRMRFVDLKEVDTQMKRLCRSLDYLMLHVKSKEQLKHLSIIDDARCSLEWATGANGDPEIT